MIDTTPRAALRFLKLYQILRPRQGASLPQELLSPRRRPITQSENIHYQALLWKKHQELNLPHPPFEILSRQFGREGTVHRPSLPDHSRCRKRHEEFNPFVTFASQFGE